MARKIPKYIYPGMRQSLQVKIRNARFPKTARCDGREKGEGEVCRTCKSRECCIHVRERDQCAKCRRRRLGHAGTSGQRRYSHGPYAKGSP